VPQLDPDAEGVERDDVRGGHPSQPTRGLGQWSNYIIMYERDVKYGER